MAKYELHKPIDLEKFERYCKQLIKAGRFVELKTLEQRSSNQNRYLHLLLGWFSASFGYSMAHTKLRFFKKICNKEIFFVETVNKKNGDIYTDIRSTADLTTLEMTLAIDRFRDYSAKNGLYLPQPNEVQYLREIEKELDLVKQYL